MAKMVADSEPCRKQCWTAGRKSRQRLGFVADAEKDMEGTYSLKVAFRNLNERPGGEDDPTTAVCFPENTVVRICEGKEG